jgi:hypothetical protein
VWYVKFVYALQYGCWYSLSHTFLPLRRGGSQSVPTIGSCHSSINIVAMYVILLLAAVLFILYSSVNVWKFFLDVMPTWWCSAERVCARPCYSALLPARNKLINLRSACNTLKRSYRRASLRQTDHVKNMLQTAKPTLNYRLLYMQ